MREYNDREHIKLNRKILNWEWYSDPCTRDVFIHCLLKANWKDGKWHGYDYKRGQFITSLPTLAAETGFTIQNIRTAIKNLKSTGELTDWHDSKIRIITVVKYDEYQSLNRQSNRRLTDGQQSDSVTELLTSKKSKKNQQSGQQTANRPQCADITGFSHNAIGLSNSLSNSLSTDGQQTTNRQPTAVKEYKKNTTYSKEEKESATTSGVKTPSSAPREKSIYERMRE